VKLPFLKVHPEVVQVSTQSFTVPGIPISKRFTLSLVLTLKESTVEPIR